MVLLLGVMVVGGYCCGEGGGALGPGQRNDAGNLEVAEVAAGILCDLFYGLMKIGITC